MANVTLKLDQLCSAGGSHGRIVAAGDMTGSFAADLVEAQRIIAQVQAMTVPQRAYLAIALHGVLNGLTPAQVKADLVSANGVPFTL